MAMCIAHFTSGFVRGVQSGLNKGSKLQTAVIGIGVGRGMGVAVGIGVGGGVAVGMGVVVGTGVGVGTGVTVGILANATLILASTVASMFGVGVAVHANAISRIRASDMEDR